MAEAAAAIPRVLPKFRLGEKKVFLPFHLVILLHKEHLPATEACFQVPLSFTKFDLRDYLWNLYGVGVKTVRSYVKQKALVQRPDQSNSKYRPQSLKIMTVELMEPFRWPEPPTDTAPFYPELWQSREKNVEAQRLEMYNKANMIIPLASKQGRTPKRRMLARAAADLLAGHVKWTNDVVLDPKWDAILAKRGGGETRHKGEVVKAVAKDDSAKPDTEAKPA